MDFTSTKRVRGQSNRAGLQDSSRAAPFAGAAAFERQLSEIANSGGGGGAMPTGSAPQPPQFVKRLSKRPFHFRDEDSNRPLHPGDSESISALEAALIKGKAAENTARVYLGSLLRFGRWLFANNKDPMKDRLDDQSLTDDVREFIGKRNPKTLGLAIDHLRTLQSTGGIVLIAGPPELIPYPQDVALIDEYKNEVATNTGKRYAADLRSFSDYLRQNNKKGIAGRLSGKKLDGDVKGYKEDAGGHPNIGYALPHLRKSQAGAKAMELERRVPPVPDPEDAALVEPRRVGEAIAQHSASHEAGSWRKELRGQQDNQPARSFFIAPGKLPVGLNNRNSIGAGAFGPSGSRQAGVEAAARPLLALSEQQIRRSPGAPDRGNLLPTEWVNINNEHSTALLRPAKRQRNLNAPPAVAIQQQLSGIGNLGGRRPIQPSTYEVGALMPGSESEYIPRLQSEPRGIGGATAQHSAPHDAIASRFVVPMEDYDQDLLWEGVAKAGPLPSLGSSASHYQPPASAGAVHALNGRHDRHSAADELAGSNVLPRRQDGGFEAMVHQNPPTPFELNAWVPAPDFPPPFTGPVPVHHQGARQPGAPQGLSPVPASSDDEALAWLGEELVRRRIQEPALPSAAHLPVQSFGEERLLGSAADRADEDGAPAKRQSTLNNPPEIAVQGLLSESGNSGARVLMQPATSLRPAINEAQIRRGRLNNPDAPKKDLDGFKRPADRTQNSTLVTVGSDKRALFSQDASLIEVLESAFRKGKVAETTFRLNVNPLLQFARWLVDSGKQGFATRLDETTLKQDLKQYERSGGPSLEAPMRHLKTAEAGGVPIAGHALRNPYAQDEALIKLYNATPSAKNADRDRVMRYTSALKRFSDYLQKNGKMGIAARLNDKTLDDDAKLHPGGYIGIHAALVQLRKSGAGELGFEGHIAPVLRDDAHFAPAHPARVRSGTFGGLQSFVDLNAPTPSDLRDDAHFAPAAPARARSGTFGGLQSFVDLNAPTPSDLRDDAHFAPAAPARARSGTFGGLQSFVDLNAPTPSDLGDDAHFAPAAPARARSGTFGGLQSFVDLNAPTPSDLRDDAHSAPVRPREQMLRETEWQPMMQATGSAAVFRPGGPDDVRLIHRGRLSPMSEAAPAPLARAPQPAPSATARLPETYRGLPVVDLTRPTTSSSDAQIGALDPAASSKVPNGSVLGADEWLSDAHILRDYHLLEERLRGINPTLAGQTRLVDPLIANGPLRLRSSSEIDRLYALQRILYDHNGNDTADFLFLPVNNATEHNLGTHWSLLLVDRRNRERPVAYHYDSLQRKGYNDVPATQLARLLNATLMPARMPPQGNDYDCGVFVVDGTWALVGRLLDGERPDHEPLHLDNLVADRQALQDRLRGRLPHEEETGELRLLLDDQPASPQMIAFGPAELWQLLDDEPAASSPRSSSTPDAGRDSVHEPAKAPWLPRSQG